MARDEPSLDPARLAPLRLVNHAKDHPTFAQAVATKSEISSWSLESLQSLQADLFKMSTEASKRMKKLQEMQQYLSDVAAGREPAAPTESSPVSSPAQAGETADAAGEPRLMANMANDDSDVDMTDTKSAGPKAKRKLDSEPDSSDDSLKRRRSEAADAADSSNGSAASSQPPPIKISLTLSPDVSSSSTGHDAPHAGKGLNKKASQQQQQQQQQQSRRRRSSKATTSSRNVLGEVGGEDGDAGPNKAAPPSSSAPSPAANAASSAGGAASASAADAAATGRSSKGNQTVPYETFRAFIEPFVRPYTDAELDMLEPMEDTDPYPFLIRPLGKHYLDVWAEESGESPAKPAANETESNGVPFLGTLTERLLASLVEEGLTVPSAAVEDDDGASMSSAGGVVPSLPALRPTDLENRIRRELVYAGLLDEMDDAGGEAQDDEICTQLRTLQQLLRQQISLNNARRARLYTRVKAQLGYQEYEEVLGELHRQIEAGYVKRQKQVQPRGGKKKGKNAATSRVRPPVPEDLRQLIARSDRLPRLLRSVFASDIYSSPTQSIYEGFEATPNPDYRAAIAGLTMPSRIVTEMTAKDAAAHAGPPQIVGRG